MGRIGGAGSRSVSCQGTGARIHGRDGEAMYATAHAPNERPLLLRRVGACPDHARIAIAEVLFR